jgi:hypothetical protein
VTAGWWTVLDCVYGKGHGPEGSGGGMFASSNIRVLLSIYFQLPPTEKISGNCTLELRR